MFGNKTSEDMRINKVPTDMSSPKLARPRCLTNDNETNPAAVVRHDMMMAGDTALRVPGTDPVSLMR